MALPDDCNEGDYVLKRENATTWMATAPCYDDPQMSPVGYGNIQQDAVDDLVQKPQFQAFLKRSGRRPPTLEYFTVDNRPFEEIAAELARQEKRKKLE